METLIIGFFEQLLGWMERSGFIAVAVSGVILLIGIGVILAAVWVRFFGTRVQVRLVGFYDDPTFHKTEDDNDAPEEPTSSFFPLYDVIAGVPEALQVSGNVGCKPDENRIGEVSGGIYFANGHGRGKPSVMSYRDCFDVVKMGGLFIGIGVFMVIFFGGAFMEITDGANEFREHWASLKK